MGSQSSVRLTWSEICSNGKFRGRWVALDGVRYDEATNRPTEGTVVDCDDDIAELCSRLRTANRRCCAVLHCEERESNAGASRSVRPRAVATHQRAGWRSRVVLRLSERDGAVLLSVRVAPRASRDAVLGEHDGALKVSLTAPPADGAANSALIAFLSALLGIAKRDIVIVRGDTGRTKLVALRGTSIARVQSALEQ